MIIPRGYYGLVGIMVIILLIVAAVLAAVQAWVSRPTGGTAGWLSVALLDVALLLAVLAGVRLPG